jgi:DNA primase
VVPDKQIFKDFSSGKGGTVVTFLMEHEHFTYPEALRWLAHKYGIEIQEEQITEADKEEDVKREKLLRLYAFAAKWFTAQMRETDEGKSVGLGYFKSRQITENSMAEFALGYCPEKGALFASEALAQGYDEAILIESGLIKKIEDRAPYDAYRGRVIFPIHNISGAIIAFGARILQKDAKAPKYINSPETAIYHKSKVLYGLYQAKNEIVRQQICYLVEGYTDVISLHQAGIRNAVSSSGTALTREQIRLIKRYTSNITLIYDGDKAGIRASFRGIDLILEEGLNVRALLLPENEDPDSFARERTKGELEAFFKAHVQDFISFKTGILSEEVGNDPIKKSDLIKEIVASIALIPDIVQRTVYIKQCSTQLDMTEQVLLNSLNAEIQKRHKEQRNRQSTETDTNQFIDLPTSAPRQSDLPEAVDSRKDLEHDLMRLIVRYGDCFIRPDGGDDVQVAPFIIHELERDDIKVDDSSLRGLMAAVSEMISKDEWEPRHLTHHSDYEISMLSVDLLTEKYRLDKWEVFEIMVYNEDLKLERAVQEAIYSLKLYCVRKEIEQLQETLKQIDSHEKDTALMEGVLFKINRLNAIKSQFSKAMGRIILG